MDERERTAAEESEGVQEAERLGRESPAEQLPDVEAHRLSRDEDDDEAPSATVRD